MLRGVQVPSSVQEDIERCQEHCRESLTSLRVGEVKNCFVPFLFQSGRPSQHSLCSSSLSAWLGGALCSACTQLSVVVANRFLSGWVPLLLAQGCCKTYRTKRGEEWPGEQVIVSELPPTKVLSPGVMLWMRLQTNNHQTTPGH